ncbi:GrpB family protein [Candidatus Leptofilum sp.]|uniref:GrpB family protein n=1 Tax=Candidatus Leptofilum sp. TaxID=3241576 RepID=UPI003B590EEF
MGRKVIVTPHDPVWTEQYKTEAARLTSVFQPILVAIHHFGSTAIPGINAKPVIDILIVVKDITAVIHLIDPMAQQGYLSKGEKGISGRHYFRKGSDAHHTHHVHVYEENHPEIARHLNFRDYLRHHPEDAIVYSQLKEHLAQTHYSDPAAYTDSKSTFIRNIDLKARLWRQAQVEPS